jgi:hypothetical protein
MKANYNTLPEITRVISGRNLWIIPAILFLFVSSFRANSQTNSLSEKWAGNTAFIITPGKWESGIFQPFRFGLNNRIELMSNAVLMPFLPNAGVKISLRSEKGFLLASEHLVSYPTLFLNLMSFKGTGGLISPQYSFPFIITFSNSLLVTKLVGSSSLLTADAGFIVAIRGSKPDYRSSIDIPFIYQRMAHYYDGVSVRAGISFKGTIIKNLFFEEGARVFLITRNHDNIFIENSGAVLWSSKSSFRLKGGYLLSWGKYPFGKHLQLWPAFDIIFGSRNKIKKSSTLITLLSANI